MAVRLVALLLLLSLCIPLTGCTPEDGGDVLFTDSLGYEISVRGEVRAAACYASVADCWLLSGGELVAVTEDALTERDLPLPEDIPIVGTVKEINLEQLVSSGANFVLLSASLAAHTSLRETLLSLGIAPAYIKLDTFSDYLSVMRTFSSVSGRDDLYRENALAVSERIAAIKAKIPAKSDITVLLVRAYSSGIRAKGEDTVAGAILAELGCGNIADKHPSLLDSISEEFVISEDPDYIFVLTMGNEAAALSYLEESFINNPAFSSLSALREGRIYLLPKELFHYKPNDNWDESYEYLCKIIYPESFVE